jgi:UDP-N-acetylglucosamine 1-carboxyvinyltransferase
MNQKFIINGGKKIEGEIQVQGAKNFVLKALIASLLTDEESTIIKTPQISDVSVMLEIIKKIGFQVKKETKNGKKTIKIKPERIKNLTLDEKESSKVRTSIMFSAPLLARQKKFSLYHPGGDIIGKRPIDLFLNGFTKMGAKIKKSGSFYNIYTKKRLQGAKIFFPKISVTGTETLAMTAVLAKGTTILENVAKEPEVTHLLKILNQMGAKIEGIGTSKLIIEGVEKLKSGNFEAIPDRLETGTFLMLGLMNNASVKIKNCNPNHIQALLERLDQANAKLEIGPDYIITKPCLKKLKAVSIQTHEYPGFATDLQPIYTLLMTQVQGASLIHEPIFEGRLFFTDILNRMGANIIMCDPHRVVINGPSELHPKTIESPDIRAGMTLILAAILAKGTSTIENAQIIDRGYEKIEQRLQQLGVDIKRI